MIPSTVSRNDYAGSGSTATYAFVFQIVSPVELIFLETVAGATTVKLLNTDYTVSQNQDITTGGTVTRVAGNLPVGTNLAIIRAGFANQPNSFSNNAVFFPSAYESSLDYIVKAIQYYTNQQVVSVQAPQAEVPGTATFVLPPISTRANMALGFDGSGSVIAIPLGSAAGQATFPNYLVASNVALLALVGMTGGQIAYQQDLGLWWGYNAADSAWEKVGFVIS